MRLPRRAGRRYIEGAMRALMLEPPPEMFEERRRKGLDRWDEVWDGVIHMLPPPSRWHQSLERALIEVLAPLSRSRGLELLQESGLFRGDQNYRVPDLMVFRPEHGSDRGVESHAEVVIELLSPQDESREKLPFYESLGYIRRKTQHAYAKQLRA